MFKISRCIPVLILVFSLCGGLAISSPPAFAAGMTYLEYRQILPKVAPESFNGQPRRLWRIGKEMMRLEEPVNPKTKRQRLTVIQVPDIWVVDRTHKIGRHRDNATPIKIPVFPPAPQASWTQELEYGKEIAFFQEQDAEIKRGEKIGNLVLDRYRIQRDGIDLILFVRADQQVPLRIMMRVGDKAMGIQYTRYEPNLKPKPGLFQEPAGIKWKPAQ